MNRKEEESFQVFARMSNGTLSPPIDVPKDGLLIDLLESIERTTNIAPSHKRLIFNGKVLDDDARSLESYMLIPLSTVQLSQVRPRAMDHQDGITTHNYNPTPQKKSTVTPPLSQLCESFMFSHVSIVQLQVSTPDVDNLDGITTHDYNQTPQRTSEMTPSGSPCLLSDQEYFDRQHTIDDSESFMFNHNMSTGQLQVRPPDVNTTDLHATSGFTDRLDWIPTHTYNSTQVQVPKAVTPLQCGLSNHGNSDRQCKIDDRAQSSNSTVECEPSDQNSQSFLSKFFDFITGLFGHDDPYELDMDYMYGMISTPQGSGVTYLNNHAPPTYSS